MKKNFKFQVSGFRYQRGFTLIELLLYVGLAAVILLAVSTFLSLMLDGRVKNQTVAEVEGQGAMAVQLIAQTVRNAVQINSPVPGVSATSLSLNVVNAATSPTVFDVAQGALRISQGTSLPVSVTSQRVIASGVSFQNLARPGSKGTIRVVFTLIYVNPRGVNIYDYSRVFIGSATLR